MGQQVPYPSRDGPKFIIWHSAHLYFPATAAKSIFFYHTTQEAKYTLA